MSGSGSFGVNYKKVWDGVTIPLPAQVGDIGHSTEGTFMFVKAAEAITQYDFVAIQNDYTILQLENANALNATPVGAAQVAAATNEYLWVFIGGPGGGGTGVGIKGRFINYAANGAVYTTATPGVCDDASGGSFVRILNVRGMTLVGAVAAAAELQTVNIMATQ